MSFVVAPIDPLARTHAGRYEDAYVTVEAVRGGRPPRDLRTVRTAHFDLTPADGRIRLSHVVPADAIDDNLAGLLQDELFGPGWLRGQDLFERVFTGVVRTSAADPVDSWELFYRNSLARLTSSHAATGTPGSIDGYAPVHDHALALLADGGSVLQPGCGLGLLALRVAATGRPTSAADTSTGTVRLLGEMSQRLGIPLTTSVADAARHPGADGSFHTVLVVHLLEHLDAAHGDQVVAEALRLATRRVVVAVPLEEEAEETFGHVRTVSLDDLTRWGRSSGRRFEVHEHHGGWLVLDP